MVNFEYIKLGKLCKVSWQAGDLVSRYTQYLDRKVLIQRLRHSARGNVRVDPPDGITVNYDPVKRTRYNCTKRMGHTTSGIDEKLLLFRFRYLRREKSAKAVGRVVSRLYPSVILREA